MAFIISADEIKKQVSADNVEIGEGEEEVEINQKKLKLKVKCEV